MSCFVGKVNRKGFTLVEIMVVVAIIGLVIAVVLPQFQTARNTAGNNVCIANLKKIDEAKDMWAVWEGGTSSDTPVWSQLVPDYIKTQPGCPLGGTYSINRLDEYASCTVEGHEVN